MIGLPRVPKPIYLCNLDGIRGVMCFQDIQLFRNRNDLQPMLQVGKCIPISAGLSRVIRGVKHRQRQEAAEEPECH